MEEERAERMKCFLDELEQRAASFTDEEVARIERIIMDRRGHAAAPAIVAPIGRALAQPSNPRSRCSGVSFDLCVCMEESTEDKMDPERGKLESSSAGTSREVPGQQLFSSWEMQRTTVDDCLLVYGSLNLGETTFSLK